MLLIKVLIIKIIMEYQSQTHKFANSIIINSEV